VKRWQVQFDGVSVGAVYAETLDAAKKEAVAAYARVHPEREGAAEARVKVDKAGADVASELNEARQLANEVYEGLRLLPGMELPAEKQRSIILLLEAVAARTDLETMLGQGKKGASGDNALQEAAASVLESRSVGSETKNRLRGLIEWVGLNTPEAERRKIELAAFQTLWDAGLIDARFSEVAPCALHRASRYLTARLVDAGALRLERFKGVARLDGLRAALQPYGKDAVVSLWGFLPEAEGGQDAVEVLRPLALLGDRPLQPALVMRGVASADPEVVAFDRSLFDALARLRGWQEGLGRQAEPHLKEAQQQLLPRTIKRVEDQRAAMAKAAKEGGADVLPTETARRDLVKFVIDQVYRLADALTFLPDRGLREAYDELVLKDIVYRAGTAYLSKRFGIAIDTDVVEGADALALSGRVKNETGGPRPRTATTRIASIVTPCYTQDGVAIRPASVRTGDY
jgi:hypothetical protein